MGEAMLIDLDIVERAIRISRVAVVSQESIAFVSRCIDHDGWLDRMALRASQPLLEAAHLHSLGLRSNTKLSREFWAILNNEGKASAIESANAISTCFNRSKATAQKLGRWIDVAGPESLVTKIENNMLAGPCEAVKALPEIQQAGQAQLFPLLDCTHPDQCACLYQAKMTGNDD